MIYNSGHNDKLKSLLIGKTQECCDIGFASLNYTDKYIDSKYLSYYNEFNTTIAVIHHITDSREWVWYKNEKGNYPRICDADIHLNQICQDILKILNKKKYNSKVLPYPGRSGFQFINLAAETNLGEIGDNKLFIHKNWGPWVHLRIVLTSAIIEPDSKTKEMICTHCDTCVTNCPPNALANGYLNGIICDDYQTKMKQEKASIEHYVFTCESCIRSCKMFEQPKQLSEEEIEEFVLSKY
jgi:ferredoxin